MRIRKKQIRLLVERVLSQCAVHSAPVPVEKIAQSLGLEIRRTEAEDSLSGFLLRDVASGQATIGVNSGHAPNRQRFTIAHEIAHFLLHGGESLHVDERSEIALKVSLRDNKASEGVSPEEVEANYFAAELLMPAEFLKKDLKVYDPLDLLDEGDLDKLLTKMAKDYQVSKSALTFRLVNLNYVTH